MQTYDPQKNDTEVRQGNRRMMNSRVLIISLIVLILAFAAIYLFFSMQPSTGA